jgi:hypothetical protein
MRIPRVTGVAHAAVGLSARDRPRIKLPVTCIAVVAVAGRDRLEPRSASLCA